MKRKRFDAMAGFAQLLVLIAIFLLASYANAVLNLNQVVGNQIWLNHLIRFKETNKQNSKQILIRSLIWMVKQQIKDWNGMQSFSISFQQNKSQNCFWVSQCRLMKRSFEDHQMLPAPVCKQTSYSIQYVNAINPWSYTSPLVLFSTICPFGGLSCMAHSLQEKVPLLHHESSCASQLAVHAQCLKSHKTSCVFQLVALAKVSTNTSQAVLPNW